MRFVGFIAGLALVAWLAPARAAEPAGAPRPELVVHVGATDGALDLARGADGRSTVHGLARDEAGVQKAREAIRKAGAYGRVSVSLWRGAPKLPYVDSIVNRLIVAKGAEVEEAELRRVLAPGGVLEREGQPPAAPAPFPKEFGEWTHRCGDAGATRCGSDTRVEKPVALRWQAGPMFDIKPALAAEGLVVTMSGGWHVNSKQPRTETVGVYDAFNGMFLWEKPVVFPPFPVYDTWGGEERERYYNYCLAAGSGRLYVAANPKAVVLDLRTGKELGSLETQGAPQRVLLKKDVVFVATGDEVSAFGLEGGKPRWTWRGKQRETLVGDSIVAVYAVDDQGSYIVGLSPDKGEKIWEWRLKTPPPAVPVNERHKIWNAGLPTPQFRPLATGHGRVLVWKARYAQLVGDNHASELVCLDEKTGQERWTYRAAGEVLFLTQPNHLMADSGSVWVLASIDSPKHKGHAMIELDPEDGKERRRSLLLIWNAQCAGGYMTARYLFPRDQTISRDDPQLKSQGNNKLSIRAGCGSWSVPAFGTTYTGAHFCACHGSYRSYPLIHLKGQIGQSDAGFLERDEKTLTEKGPGAAGGGKPGDDEWPQFLRDSSRTNCHPRSIAPEKLAVAWHVKLPVQGEGSRWREDLNGGAALTAPVAANGLVCAADGDGHTVYALDAASGRLRWSFMAGGAVDSPPALVGGKVVFGSADGWVYALSAADGALVWRTRLARNDSLRPISGQLMSPWAVHGSVLVEGERVVTLAGWYAIESEQVRAYGLSLDDGKIQWEQPLEGLRTKDRFWYQTATGVKVNRNEILGLVEGRVFGLDPATGKVAAEKERWNHLDLHTFNITLRNPRDRTQSGPLGDAQQTAVWKGQWLNLAHRSQNGQLQLLPGKAEELAKPSRATTQGQLVPELPRPQKVLSPKTERFLTMMVAGDVAFVAGSEGPENARKFFLWSFRCEDLSPLGKLAIPAEPTHRGLIACGDRLYLSCTDGSVVCLSPAP